MRPFLPDDYLSKLGSYLGLDLTDPPAGLLKSYADCIAEMSQGLKRKNEREAFIGQTYLDQKLFREAYLLYYTTSNLLKIHFPLSELSRSGFFPSGRELHILDLGSGTGTMLFGFALWARENWNGLAELTASDVSSPALGELEKFYRHCEFPYPLKTIALDMETITQVRNSYDLIFMGNALNELSAAGEANVADLLESSLATDGFAILIEPAQIDTSRRLLAFRDKMISEGWFVYAPCFTQKPCPSLIKETDWCHHSMAWERPKFIERIDDKIGHVKKSLKFSYLILSRQDRHMSDHFAGGRNWQDQFRAVSERIEEKGRSRCFMCNDRGRIEVMRQKRDCSDSNREWENIERYDAVTIGSPVEKKNYLQVEKATRVVRL